MCDFSSLKKAPSQVAQKLTNGRRACLPPGPQPAGSGPGGNDNGARGEPAIREDHRVRRFAGISSRTSWLRIMRPKRSGLLPHPVTELEAGYPFGKPG